MGTVWLWIVVGVGAGLVLLALALAWRHLQHLYGRLMDAVSGAADFTPHQE